MNYYLLTIDSENSVFYLVMLWLLYDKESRLPLFGKIINYFQFERMKRYFLLDIIPNVYKYLDDAQAMELSKLREQALQYLSDLKHPNNRPLPPERVRYPDCDKVKLKFIFRNISEWETGEKYHSQPVFSNGYVFYFFLGREEIKSNNPDYVLAGFLRISGAIIPSRYFLPIAFTVAILTPNHANTESKFSTMRVIFEDPKKVIGQNLTVPDERWEDVIRGYSPIVHQDNITVMVSVEFLDSAEDCTVNVENFWKKVD